jgi:excisionase family DNA binding protein
MRYTFWLSALCVECHYLTIFLFIRRENMVMQMIQEDVLLTFKEAMHYLRVSRSTLYRLMWSGQLTGHKVGSTWRFYREDLRACVGREIPMTSLQPEAIS